MQYLGHYRPIKGAISPPLDTILIPQLIPTRSIPFITEMKLALTLLFLAVASARLSSRSDLRELALHL